MYNSDMSVVKSMVFDVVQCNLNVWSVVEYNSMIVEIANRKYLEQVV